MLELIYFNNMILCKIQKLHHQIAARTLAKFFANEFKIKIDYLHGSFEV